MICLSDHGPKRAPFAEGLIQVALQDPAMRPLCITRCAVCAFVGGIQPLSLFPSPVLVDGPEKRHDVLCEYGSCGNQVGTTHCVVKLVGHPDHYLWVLAVPLEPDLVESEEVGVFVEQATFRLWG